MGKNVSTKLTGVVVPLGALYSQDNPVIGCFSDLIPFAQFCKEAGFKIIQLLPINDTGTQSSPYSGLSAFALHPIYIRIKEIPGFEELHNSNQKFQKAYDIFLAENGYSHRYSYNTILNLKINLLQQLYEVTTAGATGTPDEELSRFIKNNPWIKTYSVYKNLKWSYMQASWKTWLQTDQYKTQEEIEKLWNTKAFKKEHLFFAWCQMIAANQFSKAVEAVHKEGIILKGDMPILMNEDSCDTWAYPQFFNQDLRAGAPADGENPCGQNWGFPTYNWKNLKQDNYSWWKDRLKITSNYYDAYRLDHILGFFRIWAIPTTDCNALTGHTEPYSSLKLSDLYEAGFDDDRIKWLSKPHIPTYVIEDITWNHDNAHKILKKVCNQIGNEELWLFKDSILGSQQLSEMSFEDIVDKSASDRIKSKLIEYWSNRTLLEIQKGKFIPLWTYGQSTSWNTLNNFEKENLKKLFTELESKNDKLWKKQADEIFTAITSDNKMIPCGEDLGVNIESVPKVMKAHNILGLRVVRWCREWSKENQPYINLQDYEPISLTTTSVHDTTTIRQWYNEEFEKQTNTPFSEEIAFTILHKCSESASMWYINPLQDYLYMNKKYWLPTAAEERINVPGTVTEFNWTYRLPVSLEELMSDNLLIEKIREISRR